MEVASDQHTTFRNCISSALLCIVIAGIICELGLLLVTCIAQFEPLFSAAEALGGLLLASIPLVIVSIIALIDLIAVSRQFRICRIVLIYGWLGYAAGVALGMVTHEVRRASSLLEALVLANEPTGCRRTRQSAADWALHVGRDERAKATLVLR